MAAAPGQSSADQGLLIGIARRQHGGEPRDFFLTTPPFARLFVAPAHAHIAQGTFAINLLLETTQRFINGLAFFQFNLGQSNSLPSRGIGRRLAGRSKIGREASAGGNPGQSSKCRNLRGFGVISAKNGVFPDSQPAANHGFALETKAICSEPAGWSEQKL